MLKNISILVLIFIAGCNAKSVSVEKLNIQQSATVASKNFIDTNTLNPQSIRISLEDLPQPYATSSASKPPQVVPIPENPSLLMVISSLAITMPFVDILTLQDKKKLLVGVKKLPIFLAADIDSTGRAMSSSRQTEKNFMFRSVPVLMLMLNSFLALPCRSSI